MRSGDSEESVYSYSPIGVNATLHCAVNSTNLLWGVDMLHFDVDILEFKRNLLETTYYNIRKNHGISCDCVWPHKEKQ